MKQNLEMRIHLYSQQFEYRFFFAFHSIPIVFGAMMSVKLFHMDFITRANIVHIWIRGKHKKGAQQKNAIPVEYIHMCISHSTITTVIKFYFHLRGPFRFLCIFAIILRVADYASAKQASLVSMARRRTIYVSPAMMCPGVLMYFWLVE